MHGKGRVAVIQRAYRAKIDRACKALADQSGIRSLVDEYRVQQLRRILVEFHAAIVAGADLLTTIQQRRGKTRIRSAQADGRGAAFGALRGQAGQARDCVGNTGVGQPAEIFS